MCISLDCIYILQNDTRTLQCQVTSEEFSKAQADILWKMYTEVCTGRVKQTGLTSSLFWGVTRRRFTVIYGRFRTTYRPHLQEWTYRRFEITQSIPKMDWIGCPETSVTTNLRRVTSQKSEGLIYAAAKPWNHTVIQCCHLVSIQLSVFLILNFRRVPNVEFFLLGDTPASEFYVPTFRNTLFHLHRWCQQVFLLTPPMKME